MEEQVDTESLDTILSDEPAAEVQPDEPAAEAAADSVSDDKPAQPPEGYVPVAALHEERGKRQGIEGELRAIKELTTKPEPTAEPEAPIDFLEDPDRWQKQVESKWQAELSAANAKIDDLTNQMPKRFAQFRVNWSEQAARKRHDDFDKVANVFADVARTNPALVDEMHNAEDPAEYAYVAGKRLGLLADHDGDLEKLLESAREEGRAEALQGKTAGRNAAADIPISLTKTPSAGEGRATAQPINESLDDIVLNRF